MNNFKILQFKKSNKKNKKYDVYVHWFDDDKIYKISFGSPFYQHYEDKTPLKYYEYLNHYDKKRRRLYLARAKKIKDKEGNLTYKNPLSPNYYSINYLW